MSKIPVAIIGSGNIGTDLLMKIQSRSQRLDAVAMVGIDPASAGLARAREQGVAITADGIEGLIKMPCFESVQFVFDATSAVAHARHAELLRQHGKQLIDLTPAAIGPYVVPTVNLDQHLQEPNINMVTCGGQATIPMVAAVNQVAPVVYGEIVASISSRSAGPGTRANIDEFTQTTARAIEIVGGAKVGKAIIVLNPAEPPLLMRNTVFCFVEGDVSESEIRQSVQEMVGRVQKHVPGYRLKQDVQFDRFGGEQPTLSIANVGSDMTGVKVTVYLEVEGAGDFLPSYAGNWDIMTSAAMATGERLVELKNETISIQGS